MQTTTGWAWWEREKRKENGGERGGRRTSSRGERNVALPRSDIKINRPRGEIKTTKRNRVNFSSLRAEKRCFKLRGTSMCRVDKNGIFRIDRSSVWSNPCKESVSMFEKEESHWYVTYARAVHGSQSSLRGFVLFYAPQLEADRWDPLSAQVPNRWSPRFLRVTLGRICRDKFRISPIHRQRWSASYYCRRKNSCNYSTTAGFELAMSHRSVEYHRAQNYSP